MRNRFAVAVAPGGGTLALPRPGASMIGSSFFYRRLASPLHATRASVGALWALSLTAAALMLYHPLVLLALLLGVLGAGWGAASAPRLARSLRTARSWRCRSCSSTCSSAARA